MLIFNESAWKFAGTSVASGAGEGEAFATGMSTTSCHIAHATQSVRAEASPLQIQLGMISRTVTTSSILTGAEFFLTGNLVAHLSLKAGAIFARLAAVELAEKAGPAPR